MLLFLLLQSFSLEFKFSFLSVVFGWLFSFWLNWFQIDLIFVGNSVFRIASFHILEKIEYDFEIFFFWEQFFGLLFVFVDFNTQELLEFRVFERNDGEGLTILAQNERGDFFSGVIVLFFCDFHILEHVAYDFIGVFAIGEYFRVKREHFLCD